MEAWWWGARNGGRSSSSPSGERAAGGGVDAGHRERLGGRQRREQADQAFGQHRLARTGRTDHEQVVTSRRGDFHGASSERLTAHVGQVGRLRRRRALRGGRDARPGGCRAGTATSSRQRGRTAHLLSPDQRRLTDVTERHDHAEGACRVGQGDHAGHVAQ